MTPEVELYIAIVVISAVSLMKVLSLERRLIAELKRRIEAEWLAATYRDDADTYRRVIRERHGRAK